MTPSFRKLLDNAVQTNGVPLGTFITSFDPAVSVVLATAGFDFVILDCEHGPMDRVLALNHVRAASLHGAVPVVRTLENSSQQIQSYFDIGAAAVMVPKIGDAETARRVAGAARYQAGGRGMCPGCDAARYSTEDWPEHVARSNAGNRVVPIIETRAGIENLAEIAAVDGIDVLMFGPGDLSQDMGLNIFTDHARLLTIWESFKVIVRDAGKLVMAPLGYGFEGADVAVQEMDLMMLRKAASDVVNAHREHERARVRRD
jgi:4-hydroxy-2-oxoheptanedioate aldolase